MVMVSQKLIINNNIDQLEKLQLFIETVSDEWSLGPNVTFELNLILEEYVTNLINYGYSDDQEHLISLELELNGPELRIEVLDDAGPFDLTETPENQEIDKSASERVIGGLGIHFIKTLSDQMNYHSSEGKNRLVITKKLSPQ
jgi:anti-sigma regulatory factor (Ser/Thr protein kinase)